jgi:hypothetical protein
LKTSIIINLVNIARVWEGSSIWIIHNNAIVLILIAVRIDVNVLKTTWNRSRMKHPMVMYRPIVEVIQIQTDWKWL